MTQSPPKRPAVKRAFSTFADSRREAAAATGSRPAKPSRPAGSKSAGKTSSNKAAAGKSTRGAASAPSQHSRFGVVNSADSRFIGALRAANAPPPTPVPPAAIRIDQVQSALGEILQWSSAADTALSSWLRAHRELGMRDRSELAEAVYDALRHLRRYQHLAEGGPGPASRRLAILALDATLPRDTLLPVLKEDESEWLHRSRSVRDDTLAPAVRASLPDWLYEKLVELDDTADLVAALNRPAALDIRVNPMSAVREKVLAGLQHGPAAKFSPQATPYSPWGIRMQGRPAINRWPQFERGEIEVQDEGSQLLALLVGPKRGEMVIDFCAGAGGKTLLLGALMRSTGRLYAFDVSAKRLAKAKPRFARSGLSNVVPVIIDSENDVRVKRLAGKAQRVLVDAPCSGVGTLRRNPDLKWRQHPGGVAELCALQRRILASASRCVAPGGRLVYATCSLLPEENQDQAEWFLRQYPDFEQVDVRNILDKRTGELDCDGPLLQLRPDRHGTDGFFAAVFQRKGAAPAATKEVASDETDASEA
ncbi:MAG: RsmB/NOP family class I SAM-dependent RNA methyltransferase [Burkholderiaceae bacterium]|nr:RsmB/NOP family class I SAM-dependent RNA methyltransferase [Burkholderiaceae bacterium]